VSSSVLYRFRAGNPLPKTGIECGKEPQRCYLESFLGAPGEIAPSFPITATALSDLGYYEFVMSAIQQLCSKAGELPCLVDAAIFVQQDGKGWNQAKAVW